MSKLKSSSRRLELILNRIMSNGAQTHPDGWTKVKMTDVAEVVTDYVANGSFASLKENVTYSAGKEYARLVRLKDHNSQYSEKDAVYVNEHSYNFLSKSSLSPEDIVISNVGEYSGTVFRVPDLGMPATLGPNSILVKFKESNDYMYYFLSSHIGQHLINSIKTGSANPKFNKTDFRALEFLLPPKEERDSIAEMFSVFDKKIQLLKEQNKVLEDMAQVLFKRWFIDFEFLNKEGKPYKSSGGRMIEGELGEMPEGWKVFKLDSLVDTINGYSYKGAELKEVSQEALVTLKSFDRNGGFQTRGFKPFEGTPKLDQEVRVGDLVVAHTDLTQDAEVLGNPAFIFDNGGYKKMYITMDLVKVLPKRESLNLSTLYFLMKTRTFKGHCVGYATGTTVLHLSKKAIPEYELALPEDDALLAQYSAISESVTKKISANVSQIKSLAGVRDILLPKIMTGEVRVKM